LVGRDEVAAGFDVRQSAHQMFPVGGSAQQIVGLIGFGDGNLDLLVAEGRLQAFKKLAVELVRIEPVNGVHGA